MYCITYIIIVIYKVIRVFEMATKKQVKIPTFNQYDTVSPATKLLEKRRKMYEIHQAFQSQKQQFKQKQVGYAQEQQKIKTRDKDFQQQMTKFCQFSQQNQIKKKKAEQKIKQQNRAYAQKEQMIQNLQRQIEQLVKNQKRYQNKLSHFRKYQQYLEKVRNTYSDQYPQMQDILNRYQTLKKSNKDLIESRQKIQTDHQILKKKSLNEEKQLNHKILTISNETKDISRRIQQKLKQKNQIQSQVETSNQQFSKKNLNLGKIFMAIDNLYFRCNQNSYKLKHDFQQKQDKKQFKMTKKIEGEGAAGNSKNQDQISFEQKSKVASAKLKNIVEHMKEFKTVIDLYKNKIKQGV